MSPSLPSRSSGCGFSLMEVMVAIAVLSIGLLSGALLAVRMMSGSTQSKYMSVAATLASEKLEDLNRWDSDNPQLCVPTGSLSVGSLTADVLQTTTCVSGSSGTVNYYDDVNLGLSTGGTDCPGSSAGCFAETMSSVSGGNTVYTTTYHSPDGTITTGAPSSTSPASSTFHRRWVIESNPTINGSVVTGVRRITVLVTLDDQSVSPTVTFQMSMVRP